eukprot:6186968-Pleurochrysis_carterae.AAC.4
MLRAAWCWERVSLSLKRRRTSTSLSWSPWARARLKAARNLRGSASLSAFSCASTRSGSKEPSSSLR